MSTLLNIENLAFGYGNKVLGHLDLRTEVPMCKALTGKNGSGKSTLLKTIGGHLSPISGKVEIEGGGIHQLAPVIRATKVAMVFTGRPAVRGIDVRTFLEMGRYPHQQRNRNAERDRTVIARISEQLNIARFHRQPLHQLSDGEMQRCMIALALIQETPVVLMDEPTAFLDYDSRHELLSSLKEMAIVHRKFILISSHDLDLIEKFGLERIDLSSKKIA